MPDPPALARSLARAQARLDTADRRVREAAAARDKVLRTYQARLEAWAVATEERDAARRALRAAEQEQRFRENATRMAAECVPLRLQAAES